MSLKYPSILASHLCPTLLSSLSHQSFSIKILYAFFYPATCHTKPTNHLVKAPSLLSLRPSHAQTLEQSAPVYKQRQLVYEFINIMLTWRAQLPVATQSHYNGRCLPQAPGQKPRSMRRGGSVPLPLETGSRVRVRVNVAPECWLMAERWVVAVGGPDQVNHVPLRAGSQTPAVRSAARKYHRTTRGWHASSLWWMLSGNGEISPCSNQSSPIDLLRILCYTVVLVIGVLYIYIHTLSHIYIYKNGCVFVCMFVCLFVCVCVCLGITLERLEQFRPNLVHILLHVCVRILCTFFYFC
jgi:hypothetical protein